MDAVSYNRQQERDWYRQDSASLGCFGVLVSMVMFVFSRRRWHDMSNCWDTRKHSPCLNVYTPGINDIKARRWCRLADQHHSHLIKHINSHHLMTAQCRANAGQHWPDIGPSSKIFLKVAPSSQLNTQYTNHLILVECLVGPIASTNVKQNKVRWKTKTLSQTTSTNSLGWIDIRDLLSDYRTWTD